MANFPPKQFLVSISSDIASRPQFNHIIPFIWFMSGVWCGGLNGIHRECREFDHDDPKISSETEKYGICGIFHVLGLETRILFYQSLVRVHVGMFVRWFEGNSSAVSKISVLHVQKYAGWPAVQVWGVILAK